MLRQEAGTFQLQQVKVLKDIRNVRNFNSQLLGMGAPANRTRQKKRQRRLKDISDIALIVTQKKKVDNGIHAEMFSNLYLLPPFLVMRTLVFKTKSRKKAWGG